MKNIRPFLFRSLGYWCIVCCLGIFMIDPVQSREMSEQEVQRAVQTWVRHVTADADPDAIIERMEPYTDADETLAFIAHLKGGGFCLCGNDHLVLPVYFYSPKGKFNAVNPGHQYILWEIATRTRELRKAQKDKSSRIELYKKELVERADFWLDLLTEKIPKRVSVHQENAQIDSEPDMMELVFTPQWGQGSPYNDQCPVLTPNIDEHTLVGCTATATSQIMYYWKWPLSGMGNRSVVYEWRWRSNWDQQPLSTNPNIPAGWTGRLEWISTGGGNLRMNGYWDSSFYAAARKIRESDTFYLAALEALWNRLTPSSTTCSVNFAGANYNWAILQDKHSDPVDSGDIEAAELCYDVAVAVDTGFGVLSSGSDWWRVGAPLRDYFGYDPDAIYSNPCNIDMMTTEIQWLRPFGMGGGGGIGGHAWVIYGYNKGTDPDRQFKMNMGWDGASDGWYSLDEVPGGIVLYHNHLTHIAPLSVVRFIGAASPGDGSPANPFDNIDDAVNSSPDNTTLIFKAGSIHNIVSTPLVVNKPLILKGYNVLIQ
jgi:hypothetical protein